MNAEVVTLSREAASALLVLAERGAALDGWLAATAQLRHASPASTLDYMHPEEGTAAAFVRDFVAWTCGRKNEVPGCEHRLRDFGLAEAAYRTADLTTLLRA